MLAADLSAYLLNVQILRISVINVCSIFDHSTLSLHILFISRGKKNKRKNSMNIKNKRCMRNHSIYKHGLNEQIPLRKTDLCRCNDRQNCWFLENRTSVEVQGLDFDSFCSDWTNVRVVSAHNTHTQAKKRICCNDLPSTCRISFFFHKGHTFQMHAIYFRL